MAEHPLRLTPADLRRATDPALLPFETTAELPVQDVTIGQERAVQALRFGLEMPGAGYNIFMVGEEGTGRTTILRQVLETYARQLPVPDDWVYVNNFIEPRCPRAIRLPAGMGRRFREEMERFNTELLERIPRAFDTDSYAEARERLEQQLRQAQQQEFATVEHACDEAGFALVRSPAGLYIAPLRDGVVMDSQSFSQLPAAERERLTAISDHLEELLDNALRRLREHEREVYDAIENLDREVADYTVRPLLEELRATYRDYPEVLEYLEEVRKDIIANVEAFRDGEEAEADERDAGASLLEVIPSLRYRVNLLVDNSHTQGAPVIVEDNPTHDNLLGRLEFDVRYGSTVTDYTLIRAGALHRANGGFLILRAEDVLDDEAAWHGLKRALALRSLRIERAEEGQSPLRIITPQPIPLRVKVILIGLPETYYTLVDYDPDFAELFKVRADFGTMMPRTEEGEALYVAFVAARCAEERLLPFRRDAVARVIEYGARLSEHQKRLSTRFGAVADVLREADYWARKHKLTLVTAEAVDEALRQRMYRVNQDEMLRRQEILEGLYLIETAGAVVGQVNGLTVYEDGEHRYSLPSRITARVYPGRGAVVDVQREVHLGGPIHGKGVMTLIAYINGQYGLHQRLSMEASLSFEQIYGPMEGDSAACSELVALISALANLPARQDIAITGSFDQHGKILPVGGVNEKIEGFFETCRLRGLSGTQGVIIPAANVHALMLHPDVVEAVRAEQFHIYAVHSVDEVLTLILGREAGAMDADGRFPANSIHALVLERLKQFSRLLRHDGGEEEPERKLRRRRPNVYRLKRKQK